MCQTRNSSDNLLVGVALGAALGAGLTFLFATPKGKEVQKKVRDSYPELFNNLDGLISQLKDSLGDRYEEVSQDMQNIKDTVKDVVSEESQQAGKVVSEKVSDLGEQMENLGVKLQSMSTNKSKRFFHKKS